MTNDKKLPNVIPAPEVAAQSGSASDEGKLKALVNGDIEFKDYLGFSDEVLLSFANQGYLLFTEGRYEQAEQIFRGLVVVNPDDSYYHTALGSIYAEQGKSAEALTEFNFALELDAEDVHALANRGEIYLREGMILEAAEDFKKTIELDEASIQEAKKRGETIESTPAASRARALSFVTYEVLKEFENKYNEAKEKGEV